MDIRNRQLYESEEAAVAAGVPLDSIATVEVMVIPNGPFKGRAYVKDANGKLGRRVKMPERGR